MLWANQLLLNSDVSHAASSARIGPVLCHPLTHDRLPRPGLVLPLAAWTGSAGT